MSEQRPEPIRFRKPLQDYLKWLTLGITILNPIANDLAAQNYLTQMSAPPPHQPLPFLAEHLGAIFFLTIGLGLLTLPRWQGILALVAAPACMFLWGAGL
ncbi:MAG: hypothetical protein ABI977_34815 [Acidobacteriota bacterium]